MSVLIMFCGPRFTTFLETFVTKFQLMEDIFIKCRRRGINEPSYVTRQQSVDNFDRVKIKS